MAAFEKARMMSTDAAATNWNPMPSDEQIGKSGSGNSILTEEIRWYVGDDSISARILFMKQAWLAYRDGPAFGIGLDRAHAYGPHNSFLLFALAFGPVGWTVPLAFVALIWRNAALAFAVFATCMVSHDIFFALPLLAPIAFGLAHRNRWNELPSGPDDIATR
jgi:hypothetical protein